MASRIAWIVDDGSLDTLVQCGECNAIERYDSYALIEGVQIPILKLEEFRINAAMEAMAIMHECEASEITTDERCKELGLKAYDTALPQPWVDAALGLLKIDVLGHFVWGYDGARIFGEPVPLTLEGESMLGTIEASV